MQEVKEIIVDEIIRTIKFDGITQAEAAEISGTSQTRISEIVNYKTDSYSIERLLSICAKLGGKVQIKTNDRKMTVR